MSKLYMGVKRVIATPMTRIEYNEKRGWDLAENEKGMEDDPGYMVEYLDGGKENTNFSEHYVSWSPKEVFDKAYKPEGDGLSFGDAIELLKRGKMVAREGWNGKGMYLVLQEGTTIKSKQARGGAALAIANEGKRVVKILPHIDMRSADGSCVVGWLASQTDILSNDWKVVNPA